MFVTLSSFSFTFPYFVCTHRTRQDVVALLLDAMGPLLPVAWEIICRHSLFLVLRLPAFVCKRPSSDLVLVSAPVATLSKTGKAQVARSRSLSVRPSARERRLLNARLIFSDARTKQGTSDHLGSVAPRSHASQLKKVGLLTRIPLFRT